MELEDGAVPFIRAPAVDGADLRPAAAELGRADAGDHLELLDVLGCQGQKGEVELDRNEAADLVLHVNAVQSDVEGVVALAVDVELGAGPVCIALEEDPGLQQGQLDGVAAVEGQVQHPALIDHRRQLGVCSVDDRLGNIGGHRHFCFHGPDLQGYVDGGRAAHFHEHVRHHDAPEPGDLHHNVVAAEAHRGNDKPAYLRSCGAISGIRRHVRGGYGGAGNHRSGGIRNTAFDSARQLLRDCGCRQKEKQKS